MKGVKILVCALVLVIILSQCAFSAQVWTEQAISSGGTWSRSGPVMWGDEVYWTDARSGQNQIYVWDQAGGERLFLGGTGYTRVAGVYGNDLLVSHYVNGQFSLYLYDPVNGERLISATAGSGSAAIYGNTVAWQDTRSGVSQIYTWDPLNGERRIAPTSYDQTDPRIWGNTVVWTDDRNTDFFGYVTPAVYRWTPTGGPQQIALYADNPAIYGDKVVFRYSPSPGHWYLRQWTPQHGQQTLADLTGLNAGGPFHVWGDLVVWGYGSVMAWDPVNGVSAVHESVPGNAWGPSVYGGNVAWSLDDHRGGNTGIFVSNITPEPSSATTLLLFVLAGSPFLVRRRRTA